MGIESRGCRSLGRLFYKRGLCSLQQEFCRPDSKPISADVESRDARRRSFDYARCAQRVFAVRQAKSSPVVFLRGKRHPRPSYGKRESPVEKLSFKRQFHSSFV